MPVLAPWEKIKEILAHRHGRNPAYLLVKRALKEIFAFYLVHKIPLGRSTLGNVDLQFTRMGERLLEFRQAFAAHIDTDMELEQAGGSGVIRLVVPELDISADFAPQAKNALEGLRAAKQLAAWILGHQALIKDRVFAWGLTKRSSRSTWIG